MIRFSQHARPAVFPSPPSFSAPRGAAGLAWRAGAVALSLAALGACAPAGAATLEANPANLGAQLGKARAGDTVRLAPGTYDALSLQGGSYAPALKITGPGAVVKRLVLSGVTGVTISDLEVLSACPDIGGHPNVVGGSRSVRLERLVVHGNTACWSGLLVRDSNGVVVTGSEFYGTMVGLSRLNTSDMEISRNRFHDLQSDGTNGGCGSNVTISENHFTDFRPAPGDHPDAIQAWTSHCAGVSTDLTVTGNVYVRGTGDLSTVAQGVFVNHDDPGDQRYARVKVTGNVVLGGMYNGITVTGADGVEVADNVVAGYPDMESWIRWGDNSGQKMSGNRSQNYIWPQAPAGGGVAPSGNSLMGVVKDRGASILKKLAPAAEAAPSAADAAGDAVAREVTLAPGETLVVHAPKS